MLPAALKAAIVADYLSGMSSYAVARKHGRTGGSIRFILKRAGIPQRRPDNMPASGPDGRFQRYVPKTDAQLDALVAQATRIAIPEALKAEWRAWPLWRRAAFVQRLRHHLGYPNDRPDLPYSANVVPFAYGSEAAHAVADRANAGRPSRNRPVQIKPASLGVIYQDQLWFWNRKVGYIFGTWSPTQTRRILSRHIWEQAHGQPVPPSTCVRHVDGNPNNLDPANLSLVTRAQLAPENMLPHLARKGRDLVQAALNLANQPNTAAHDTLNSIRR